MSDNDSNNSGEHFEWKRFLLRKDRPLPKAGCSWAFYIGMLILIGYLIFMYVRYKNQ